VEKDSRSVAAGELVGLLPRLGAADRGIGEHWAVSKAPENRTTATLTPGCGTFRDGVLVEPVGIEPTTSSMPWKRSPS
jgi:hypothetical protein